MKPRRETDRHGSAWEYWYALGHGRSIAEVAKRFHVSVQAVNGWRSAFSWDRRLADRERVVSGLVAEKCAEEEAQSRADYLKLCRATVIKYAEAIQGGKLIISPSDFDRIARLEQLLRGKATDRSEIVSGPAMDAFFDAMLSVIERVVPDPALRLKLAEGFRDAAAGLGA